MSTGEPRQRLLKSHGPDIANALSAVGFTVATQAERIDIWEADRKYLGGFIWRSATETEPGAWHFVCTLSPIHCFRDLNTSVNELQRIRRLYGKIGAAWARFTESKSDRRWAEYRGLVAAMFLRQNAGEAEPTPPVPALPPPVAPARSQTTRQHDCPYCGLSYAYQGNLLNHMRRQHPDKLAKKKTKATK